MNSIRNLKTPLMTWTTRLATAGITLGLASGAAFADEGADREEETTESCTAIVTCLTACETPACTAACLDDAPEESGDAALDLYLCLDAEGCLLDGAAPDCSDVSCPDQVAVCVGGDDEPEDPEDPPRLEAPADGEPCPEGLDFAGQCYGDVVVWCEEDGTVATIDCAAEGEGYACDYNTSSEVFDCLSTVEDDSVPPAGSPCPDDLDFAGACADAVVYWCEDDSVQVYNCAPDGLSCGFDENLGIYDCLDEPAGEGGGDDELVPGDPCPDGLDDVGQCSDSGTVYWCEDDAVQAIDCAADGLACGFDDASGLYDCVEDGGSSEDGDSEEGGTDGGGSCPPGLDDAGECEGDVLLWCGEDGPESFDCGASGLTCGVEEGFADCVDATGSGSYSGGGTTNDPAAAPQGPAPGTDGVVFLEEDNGCQSAPGRSGTAAAMLFAGLALVAVRRFRAQPARVPR